MIPEIGATYKNSKNGRLYEVTGLGKHSETLEDFVIYKALYGGEFPEGQIWCRPLSNWESLRQGQTRFEKVSS